MEYICFLTVGEDEVRAWNIQRGATALMAAGRIHSDLEKGFIRAEVIGWEDFLRCGTMAKAKAEGKLRLEGKEYVVRDGDILHVRFNV
jgi:ribosome-binding ATPase YchF (GTP1/OBG family)